MSLERAITKTSITNKYRKKCEGFDKKKTKYNNVISSKNFVLPWPGSPIPLSCLDFH